MGATRTKERQAARATVVGRSRDPAVTVALARAEALLAEGKEAEACELLERISDSLLLMGRAARFERLEQALGPVGIVAP